MDRDIFEAIRTGRKRIETRAGTERYCKIKPGDGLVFVCKFKKFEKEVEKVEKFKNIRDLLEKYKPADINPACKTESELRDTYSSFPDYKDKIRKYGLIALTLK